VGQFWKAGPDHFSRAPKIAYDDGFTMTGQVTDGQMILSRKGAKPQRKTVLCLILCGSAPLRET
jgi:hypothetical protein